MGSEHARPATERARHAAGVIRDAYGGMHEWDVWIEEDPALGADGQATIEHRYRRARIAILPGMSAERERFVIAHELAHVLLSEMNVAFERIGDLLKPRLAMHAEELYTDALEPICDRFGRAICALIPDSAWEKEA